MKRIIASVLALMLMLAALPAVAENAMPQEVQVFFDAMDIGQAAYAADHEAYLQGMPVQMMSFTLSRMQYNSFYYCVLDDQTAITVCCLDGEPLAYIFDFNLMNFVGYTDATHNGLTAVPQAYSKAYPQQKSALDGYAFVTDAILQSIYDPEAQPLVSDMQDHGQTLVSSHVFSRNGQATIQLFPKAAYEGVTVQGEALTPEGNHELSAALALNSEYELVMMSME